MSSVTANVADPVSAFCSQVDDALETGKHVRRVVLRPDFQGGPGAALTVRF